MGDPAAARAVLGRLVSGDEADAPQISTATEPAASVVYRLHVGVTWPGLAGLGVDRSRPRPLVQVVSGVPGRGGRAGGMLGDVGPSAPEHWVGGFGSGDDHVLVTLHAADRQVRDEYSARLDGGCSPPETPSGSFGAQTGRR